MNNNIEITANAEYCLVYDRPLDDTGLTWRKLVAWWGEAHPGDNERAVTLDRHRRLSSGLNGAERLVLSTCARLYRDFGFDLPVLVPQVYLHYDPYSRRQRRSTGPVARQRMDFLMPLPRHKRVVVELDGVQHYADENGRASPGSVRRDGVQGPPPAACWLRRLSRPRGSFGLSGSHQRRALCRPRRGRVHRTVPNDAHRHRGPPGTRTERAHGAPTRGCRRDG